MSKGINSYINTFRDILRTNYTYSLGGMFVANVNKDDLLKMIIDSDVESNNISIGIDSNTNELTIGEVSSSKLKTAIKLVESKVNNENKVSDIIELNRINKDILKIKSKIKEIEWKKREED